MSLSSKERCGLCLRSLFFLVAPFALGRAQEPFPAAVDGTVYYCPRIDLNPASMGGPLSVELDGELNDPVWARAAFQGYSQRWLGGLEPDNELDSDPQWAVVADDQFLYVAWRMKDQTLQKDTNRGCSIFNDDAFEFYIDGLGDGKVNTGYGPDDVQMLIGAYNIGVEDPALLESGWVRGGGCNFEGAAVDPNSGENVVSGVIRELDDPDGALGWQGEIAIALDQAFSGEWHIDPKHGRTIGWDVHMDDDDTGGGQECALIWSKLDTNSTAWQTPSVWGKLQFITPGKPLARVVRDLPDGLQNGTSGTVTFTVSPVFGQGSIVVTETLPAKLVASNPTGGGVLNGNTITWTLGVVSQPVTFSYTLSPAVDAEDGPLPGTATIDGEELAIDGDLLYTGGPITADGFIKLWNHLGPLAWAFPSAANDHGSPGACDGNAGSELNVDWLQNEEESITELDIAPFPGMIVKPKYGGTGRPGEGARAAGLTVEAGDLGLVVQDQFPVWKATSAPSDTIDHASSYVHGFDADDHATYSCVYVTNHTGAAIDTQIGLGSDDSIQVFLNDTDVTDPGIAVCRGWGGAREEQNVVPVTLQAGENKVLVKILDGGGASGFRLRFQDPADPTRGLVPPAITLSTESALTPPPARVTRSFSKPAFAIGETITVTLTVAAPSAISALLVREVVPANAAIAAISNGGSLAGGVITWNLSNVTSATLTYTLTPVVCATGATFGVSTWSTGPYEAHFRGPSSLPAEDLPAAALGAWTVSSVGPASPGGASALGATDALVDSSGQGVKAVNDSCELVSVPVSGDFDLSAQIDCFEDPGLNGQAGLMIRDTADGTAAMAYLFLTPKDANAGSVARLKGVFRRESGTNKIAQNINISAQDVQTLPVWLKIKRTGNTLSFQRSPDGAAYTEVGTKDIGTTASTINFGAQPLVGLSVSGGGTGRTRATFRSVGSGLPNFESVVVGPRFHRGDADQNDKLELTDAVQILGYLFLGSTTRVPDCPDAADADDNGKVELTDAVRILSFLFLGGSPPADPGPPPGDCGLDGTDDELDCTSYTPCQ